MIFLEIFLSLALGSLSLVFLRLSWLLFTDQIIFKEGRPSLTYDKKTKSFKTKKTYYVELKRDKK